MACTSFTPTTQRPRNPDLCSCGHGPSRHVGGSGACRICRHGCCFTGCDRPATHNVGGQVYFPMCAEHAEVVS